MNSSRRGPFVISLICMGTKPNTVEAGPCTNTDRDCTEVVHRPRKIKSDGAVS